MARVKATSPRVFMPVLGFNELNSTKEKVTYTIFKVTTAKALSVTVAGAE